MEDFLRRREVSQETLAEMTEDGIDEMVISSMTIEQLSKYLPRYGDCLAAIAFAKQQVVLKEGPRSSEGKKSSLRDKLIAKLQGKKSDEHLRRAVPQEGNRNAKKTTKKIEVGWLHQYGISDDFKQVRQPNGGGTRHVSVNIDANVLEMLTLAKDLFFPNGQSKKGYVKDFNFYMTDQTHDRLDDIITVKQIYDTTKLKNLRFYMVTIPIDSSKTTQKSKCPSRKLNFNNLISLPKKAKETAASSSDSEVTFHSTIFDERVKTDEDIASEEAATSVLTINHERTDNIDVSPMKIPYINVSTLSSSYSIDSNQATSNSTLNICTFDDNFAPGEDQSSDDVLYDPSEFLVEQFGQTNDEEKLTYAITLHRSILQDELLQHFKNHDIVDRTLKFVFVDEKGQDADGVSRDAYSGFWESFFLRNTDGEASRIPVLSNDFSQDEWESVGRILVKGYKDHKYFPIYLAPAFFAAIVHGEESVSPKLLKDSFFSFLAPSEKEILQSASMGIECDQDELLCILDRFQCNKIPTPDEVTPTIIQIAHKVLIQEPKYALDAIRSVCSDKFQLWLPDMEAITALYEQLKPTVTKVISLLRSTPGTKEENSSFGYLQKFVRGRNEQQLQRFLRLLTGSDVVCVDRIDVSFVVRYGKGRIPSIHTCGPSLELPSTYVNYPDFRSEWETILDNKDSMIMNIA